MLHLSDYDWFALALVQVSRVQELSDQADTIAQAVAKVIEFAEISTEYADCHSYYMSYGGMTITLEHSPAGSGAETLSASTYVERIGAKQAHEMTILYIAAKTILQSVADKNNVAIHYTFNTDYAKLLTWAVNGKGRKLFDWNWAEGQPAAGNIHAIIKPLA